MINVLLSDLYLHRCIFKVIVIILGVNWPLKDVLFLLYYLFVVKIEILKFSRKQDSRVMS